MGWLQMVPLEVSGWCWCWIAMLLKWYCTHCSRFILYLAVLNLTELHKVQDFTILWNFFFFTSSPFTEHPTCLLTPLLPLSGPRCFLGHKLHYHVGHWCHFPIPFSKWNEIKWNTSWYRSAEKTSNKLVHYFPPQMRAGQKQISAVLLRGRQCKGWPWFSPCSDLLQCTQCPEPQAHLVLIFNRQ